MDDDERRKEGMSQEERLAYVEREADEYRAVLTNDEKYDYQTGVCAILEKDGKYYEAKLNSGMPSENAAVSLEPDDPEQKGGLINPGPHAKREEGKRVAYTEDAEGNRVEYDPAKDNRHHAEMRLLDWAEKAGYHIVAMAPTRGCCAACQEALKAEWGEKGFRDRLPESRHDPENFSKYMSSESVHAPDTHERPVASKVVLRETRSGSSPDDPDIEIEVSELSAEAASSFVEINVIMPPGPEFGGGNF